MTLGPEEIEFRFGFHKGTTEGPNATAPQHADLRVKFRDFAELLDVVLPESRAKALTMTQLETTAMWAHKAIAEQAPLSKE